MALTDIASRTYDHGWRLDPIVRSWCCQSNRTRRVGGESLPRLPAHRQANGIAPGSNPSKSAALTA
jgi:hypothetical protein